MIRTNRVIVPSDDAIIQSPMEIPGLVNWFDFSDPKCLYTDAGSTLVGNDGDVIGRVADKSGNNNHANQTTADSKPLYKIGIKNGLSVARFDGTDDYFVAPNQVEGNNWSMFVAFKGSNNAGVFISGRYDVTFTSSNNYGVGFAIYSNKYCLGSMNGSATVKLMVSDTSFTNWNIANCNLTSYDNSIYVNNVPIGKSNGVPNPYTGYVPAIGRYIGAGAAFGHPLNGDIGEILLYVPSVNDISKKLINNYLTKKWSV